MRLFRRWVPWVLVRRPSRDGMVLRLGRQGGALFGYLLAALVLAHMHTQEFCYPHILLQPLVSTFLWHHDLVSLL